MEMTPVAAFRPRSNWLFFGIAVFAAGSLIVTLRLYSEELETRGITLEGAAVMVVITAAFLFPLYLGMPAPWRYGVFIDSDQIRIRRPLRAPTDHPIDCADHFVASAPVSGIGRHVFLRLNNGEVVPTPLVAWRYAAMVRRLNDALFDAKDLQRRGR
jgi:hypothetical protein